jgi:tetratricopeptide (TPR) repeat protein
VTPARRSVTTAAVILLIIGCGAFGADHEVLGDRAYVTGDFSEALTEYRLALLQEEGPAARLRAKAAAAARRAGDLVAATQELALLARADGQRLEEAADGLELVARDAIAAGDRPALRAATGLLRELQTGRSVGQYATALAAAGDLEPGRAAAALLPIAAANAPDARQQDSLMYLYAQALAGSGRCTEAVPVFEALTRRGRLAAVTEASRGAALCALQEGRAHLAGTRYSPAEDWFRRAITLGEGTPIGRAGYLGLGDVLKARGDLMGAVTAWERVLADAAPGDSLAEGARARINAIAAPGTANQ